MSAPHAQLANWIEKIVVTLNQDSEFRSAAEWFDSWVQLVIGPSRFSLKIFMGEIIRVVHGPTPFGVTFALQADFDSWRAFANADKNRFREMVAHGVFKIEGNVFEGMRATKAVNILMETVRREGMPGGGN